MRTLLQVHVVDPILQLSARVVMEQVNVAEVFADYFHDQGYEVRISPIEEIPHRDPIELSACEDMLTLFSEFLQERTLH